MATWREVRVNRSMRVGFWPSKFSRVYAVVTGSLRQEDGGFSRSQMTTGYKLPKLNSDIYRQASTLAYPLEPSNDERFLLRTTRLLCAVSVA
ncbi:hypothetical protein [Dendronalium sp. ChiSLP03b]|uniref:hypothetical protein n=1 Tax=Dendronalium sp. ChiSLP03b TaxID=3075381 RepID=UPI002AD2706D|nr:hypothetical protein [Dendronalium sp. ChiSLP03b]MDZ8206197.1 hypothetical protein [Dendronalium sp. ChiSLP03b]